MQKTISTQQAKEQIESGTPVIDVRTPAEFRSGHIPEAVNIPLAEITPEKVRSLFANKEVLFICQAGVRGATACSNLSSVGFEEATNIEGGTQAWIQAGYPIVKDSSSCSIISLERQVRIVAGALVVVGIILYFFTSNNSWLFLSAFVGAGLMFAGITNTCGLAAALSKMPWNK